VRLFANAFSPDGGRCFRWVYRDSGTQPMRCPGEVGTRGWWLVSACGEHAESLSPSRPAGSRVGRPGSAPVSGPAGGMTVAAGRLPDAGDIVSRVEVREKVRSRHTGAFP
jgi:hypothetical protein